MIGKRLGDYEILEERGEGGMGKFYLARNIHLPNIKVGLKILKDPSQKERFLSEAVNLSRLNHPHICQLKHFFHSENELVIVMQYVEGKTLSVLVKEWEEIDLGKIRDIFVQVLKGLEYAHQMGVHHRDLKPSNIMADRNNVATIIDFGIARHVQDPRLTSYGQAVGTPQYMAPEEFTSESTSDYTKCDIYSLGISLYEICCGRLPFQDTNPYVLKDQHCNREPDRPSTLNSRISPDLEEVILKAIAKKPLRRFSSAEEMRVRLAEASIEGRPGTTTKVIRQGVTSWMRKYWALLTAVLALAVAFIVLWLEPWNVGSTPAGPSRPKAGGAMVISVPSQTIAEGGAFQNVDLRKTVRSGDPESVSGWSYSGNKDLRIALAGKNSSVATITAPGWDWYGAETVWFVANRADGKRDSGQATFTVNGINDPPKISSLKSQQRMRGEPFEAIRLDNCVSDVDDPVESLSWILPNPRHFDLAIDANRVVTITPKPGWVGPERLLFKVTDGKGDSDSAFVEFAVLVQ